MKRLGKCTASWLAFAFVWLVILGISPKITFADPSTTSIESGDLAVALDPNYPQAITYTLKADNSFIEGSKPLNSEPYYIVINDVEYVPSVVLTKTSGNTAEYVVTVSGVDLDGEGPLQMRAITLKYSFSIAGSTLTKKITEITGDDASAPFRVQLKYPILSVNEGNMEEPGVAASNIGGIQSPTLGYSYAQASDFYGSLQELYDAYMVYNSDIFLWKHFLEQVGYAFVWNKQAVGAVYTPSSFDRPYTMRLSKDGAVKIAEIYDGVYHHRLADGNRPQDETALNILSEIWYESRVHISQDSNNNNKVDWQDGALWIKGQIPQMPAELREFFNGGNWHQTHGAFPGPAGQASTFKGFTVVNSSLDQLAEMQRQIFHMTDGVGKQSYEYVGWNGRGHDYGWPSINEIYYNPALGTDDKVAAVKSGMEPYGGDLSFHVNMTDMTSNSNAYLRGSTASPYGNEDIRTDGLQYGPTIFGWDAYQISHYTDVKNGYPFNRQNDFVERFWAPLVLYQDVMIDYPKGPYGKTEERYAKKREIDHWAALGTYAATEYYDAEKRLNGGYIFKVDTKPAVIDSFINAGVTVFHATRTYQTQPQDYLWGTIYSNNERSGNLNLGFEQNQGAVSLTKMTFLHSLLNGYLAQYGLQEYVDETNRSYTRWGEDVIYEINKTTKEIQVTKGDVTIAKGEDRFIPAIDGTERIFVYGVHASAAKTWKLPESWRAYSTLDLYELTSEGRSFVETINVVNDSVTLATKALEGYVLTPPSGSNGDHTVVKDLNLSLRAKVTSSSHTEDGYDNTNKTYTGMEFRYIPKDNAPNGDWTTVLKDMTSSMIDGQGTLRYEALVLGAFTADGVQSSYWTPNSEPLRGAIDMADGEAWVEYDLGHNEVVNKFVIKEAGLAGNKVTSFKIEYFSAPWGKFLPLYSGTEIPLHMILTDTVITNKIRLVLTGAESDSPKISEFEIYAADKYSQNYNDNNVDHLEIVNGSELASLSAADGAVKMTGGEFLVVDNNAPVLQDGHYSFKMKFEGAGDGGVGVIIRYASTDTYSWIGFQKDGVVRMRVFNPDLEAWVERSFMMQAFNSDEWYSVDLEFKGENLYVIVNGMDIYYGPLTAPGSEQPIVAGKSGFLVWGAAHAAFDEIAISLPNPEHHPVPELSAATLMGTEAGTTVVNATYYTPGNQLAIKLSSRSLKVPNIGDEAPTGAGVTMSYTSGADISGVSAGMYVGVHEVDANNKVVSFKLFNLADSDIKPASGLDPDPDPQPVSELAVSVSAGGAVGTSKVTAAAGSGNHLAIKLSSSAIAVPLVGDLAPTGAEAETGITNPYVSGSDISEVSAGMYLGVYEVNESNEVVSFKLVNLTVNNIKQAQNPGPGTDPDPSTNPNPNPGQPGPSSPTASPGTGANEPVISTGGKLQVPAGGQGKVSLEDLITITIPAGSTQEMLKLTVERLLNTDHLIQNQAMLVSPVFEVLKNFSGSFKKPVTLTLKFDKTSVLENQTVAVFYYDELQKVWVKIGGKVTGDHISVEVDHFTKFAVFIEEAKETEEAAFTDISGHWAEASIKQAVSQGMVSGYPDATFKPNQQVTRAEFIVMLMKGLKLDTETTTLPFTSFTDAAKIGKWAEQAVAQAVQAGIISGYEDNTFRPNGAITRVEMAAMAARALNLTLDAAAVTEFADDQEIPTWGKGAVAAVQQKGIVQGQVNHKFNPNGQATRAEALTVILRLLDSKE
ncbi:S-layer homology domain-containing protein [Paenibacillus eucommiae]|uniref:SLH domain-containing protein n=1 Tax=Paenibacillus eucommiae TaxID=1355755 RepID=A0ABS4IRG8_9BACL|nr:S-layer homology domain-containing protein [Paenibacillus eucommiae]MBP1990162.1 hypothetical protein [Paenibacillus eucommiae]